MNQSEAAIFECLTECRLLFPDFAARDEADVRVIMHAFRRELGHFPAQVIRDAFRAHLRAGREFPLLADIIARCERAQPAAAPADRFATRVRRLRQCGMTHLLTPDEETRAAAAGLIEHMRSNVIAPEQWAELRRAVAPIGNPSRELTRRREPRTVAAPNGHFRNHDGDDDV